MDIKDTYTRVFLQAADQDCNSDIVKKYKSLWWWNFRSKDSGGLRLTEEGFNFLTTELELKCYEIPFTESIDLSPQVIIFFDRNMDCPYFLTNSAITVFSEKKSFELYMFSDDIRKYGLIKAMNRQNQSNQNSQDD